VLTIRHSEEAAQLTAPDGEQPPPVEQRAGEVVKQNKEKQPHSRRSSMARPARRVTALM